MMVGAAGSTWLMKLLMGGEDERGRDMNTSTWCLVKKHMVTCCTAIATVDEALGNARLVGEAVVADAVRHC